MCEDNSRGESQSSESKHVKEQSTNTATVQDGSLHSKLSPRIIDEAAPYASIKTSLIKVTKVI